MEFVILVFTILFGIIQGKDINVSQYLINDDYVVLQSAEVPHDYIDGKLCNRECNGKKLKCFYNFYLETYFTLSKACFDCPTNFTDCWRPDCIVAGGTSRTVTVVNRQMPGPPIEVCQGDKVMVFLQNNQQNHESTTLHWHGQPMIRNKYMDGVPFVTQCSILKNNNFTYEFWADNAGTYWWHSHMDMQRGDGAHGAMIVRKPTSEEYHSDLYDYDLSSHVIQITDWNDKPRLSVYEGFIHAGITMSPTGLLINGLGYQSGAKVPEAPIANFVVKQGYRYRFRLINVAFYQCPMEISIDGHKILIIATDGNNLKPFEVDSFMSTSGERFDFIITADQPVSTYYIRLKGQSTCAFSQLFTAATLTYEGSPVTKPDQPFPNYENAAPKGGVIFNPVSIIDAIGYSKVIGIHEAESITYLQHELDSEHVYKFYLTVGMTYVENPSYHRSPYYGFDEVKPIQRMPTPQLNRITNKYFGVPYLQGRYQINPDDFCNDQTINFTECGTKFCSCPHVLQVPQDAIVEIIYIDTYELASVHPIHLHGHSFAVLEWQEVGKNITKEKVIRLDKKGLLKRNFVNPPIKDTLAIPKGGYAIVRFKANNIGYWLMHCHVGPHAADGMDLIIKVGDNNLMPSPPKHFPKCGNFEK